MVRNTNDAPAWPAVVVYVVASYALNWPATRVLMWLADVREADIMAGWWTASPMSLPINLFLIVVLSVWHTLATAARFALPMFM